MRGLRLLLVCLVALFLTACWSRRELTEVSFGSLLGIDWADGQYLVTLNVLAPRPIGGDGQSSASGGSRAPVWTVSAMASSLDDGLSRLDQMLPRSLTLAHTRAAYFGEAIARRGIGPTFDFLLRSVEIRPTAWMGVTPGTAHDLLKARPFEEPVPGNGPAGYHFAPIRRSSVSTARRLVHAANTLQEEGIDLSLPVFRLADRPHPAPAGALGAQPDQPREIVYGGEGVFQRDRLVAWLSPDATRGVLWVRGETVHGAVMAKCPGEPARTAVFRIRRGEGAIQMRLRAGQPEADIRIDVVADLNALPCARVQFSQTDVRPVEDILAQQVRNEVEQALQVSRASGSDFFGFGQILHRKAASAFARLEPRWPEILQDMPVTVQVKAQVPRLGQINRHYEWEADQPPAP